MDQELIEYAYDLNATSYESTQVVSMNYIDNYLALVTSTGVVMLVQDRKVKLAFRFTSD